MVSSTRVNVVGRSDGKLFIKNHLWWLNDELHRIQIQRIMSHCMVAPNSTFLFKCKKLAKQCIQFRNWTFAVTFSWLTIGPAFLDRSAVEKYMRRTARHLSRRFSNNWKWKDSHFHRGRVSKWSRMQTGPRKGEKEARISRWADLRFASKGWFFHG